MGGAGGATSSSSSSSSSGFTSSSSSSSGFTSSSSSSSSSSGVGGAPNCQQDPDCQGCCVNTYPQGQMVLQDVLILSCGCNPSAKCFPACSNPMGSSCNDPQAPMQECVDCLNNELGNNPPCLNEALQKCNFDNDCSAVLSCYQTCG